jgi:hypothetical protein
MVETGWQAMPDAPSWPQVLALSRKGLQRRGNNEEAFLKPLDDIAASGEQHPARPHVAPVSAAATVVQLLQFRPALQSKCTSATMGQSLLRLLWQWLQHMG